MGSGQSKLSGQYLGLKHEDFKDEVYMFGKAKWVSNKYFVPEKQVLSNDEVVIFTNNVKSIKGNPVLVVGEKKAVYLKDISAAQTDTGLTYAVKLKRQYFKQYTFKNEIDPDLYFEKDNNFDDYLRIAKKQQKTRRRVRLRRIDIDYNSISLHR